MGSCPAALSPSALLACLRSWHSSNAPSILHFREVHPKEVVDSEPMLSPVQLLILLLQRMKLLIIVLRHEQPGCSQWTFGKAPRLAFVHLCSPSDLVANSNLRSLRARPRLWEEDPTWKRSGDTTEKKSGPTGSGRNTKTQHGLSPVSWETMSYFW